MGYGKEKTRMSSEPPARGAGGTTVLSLSWAALLGSNWAAGWGKIQSSEMWSLGCELQAQFTV